ncbi:MAG: hypothetical protein MN733_26465 [Nitrososphaera sp.]|nr:hypothetical protein [Nitrososphaera sp.]
MSSDESSSRVKNAASLLVKGGTLISEPCTKCGGVQVRVANRVTCINCGNETSTDIIKGEDGPAVPQSEAQASSLGSVVVVVEGKIALLASEIKLDANIASQKEKADLLETYLRILERLKDLAG